MSSHISKLSVAAVFALMIGGATSCHHGSDELPAGHVSLNDGKARLNNAVCSYAHSSNQAIKSCLDMYGQAWNDKAQELSDDELSSYELCKKTGMIESRIDSCADTLKVSYKSLVDGKLFESMENSVNDARFCSMDQLCNADAAAPEPVGTADSSLFSGFSSIIK